MLHYPQHDHARLNYTRAAHGTRGEKRIKMSYQIVTLKHYYQPDLQGKEQPSFNDEYYDTVADAEKVARKLNDETYYLDHNESGRPDYAIVNERDAEYIRSGRNEDMSNYDWDGAECDCGECRTCFEMMIIQDRDYIRSNAEKVI